MNVAELFAAAQKDGGQDAVLPEGDFAIKVIRGKGNEAEGDKLPRIGLQLEIVGAAVLDDQGNTNWTHDPEEDEAIGHKAWTNLYFTEKARRLSFDFIRALGLSDEFVASSQDVQTLADALTGVVFVAETTIRKFGKDGERQANNFKVSEVVTPPAVGAAPVPSEAVEDEDEPY